MTGTGPGKSQMVFRGFFLFIIGFCKKLLFEKFLVYLCRNLQNAIKEHFGAQQSHKIAWKCRFDFMVYGLLTVRNSNLFPVRFIDEIENKRKI